MSVFYPPNSAFFSPIFLSLHLRPWKSSIPIWSHAIYHRNNNNNSIHPIPKFTKNFQTISKNMLATLQNVVFHWKSKSKLKRKVLNVAKLYSSCFNTKYWSELWLTLVTLIKLKCLDGDNGANGIFTHWKLGVLRELFRCHITNENFTLTYKVWHTTAHTHPNTQLCTTIVCDRKLFIAHNE